MDKELFNSLPYEKQVELEKWALRSILLEVSVKEFENDNRAMFSVRPAYMNPYGDEVRFYTDNYSDIRTCGNHLFSNLEFTGHVSRNGSTQLDVSYDNFYWSIDLERAKVMHNTLKWLDKRIRDNASEMFKYGMYSSFYEYMISVASAIGAIGGLLVEDGNQRTEVSIIEFLQFVNYKEQALLEKYAEVEQEAVND